MLFLFSTKQFLKIWVILVFGDCEGWGCAAIEVELGGAGLKLNLAGLHVVCSRRIALFEAISYLSPIATKL